MRWFPFCLADSENGMSKLRFAGYRLIKQKKTGVAGAEKGRLGFNCGELWQWSENYQKSHCTR
jgi:hypothetical protein